MFQESYFPQLQTCHIVAQLCGPRGIENDEFLSLLAFMGRHRSTLRDLALPSWVCGTTGISPVEMKLRKLRTSITLIWQMGRSLGESMRSLEELYVDGIAGPEGWRIFGFPSDEEAIDGLPSWPFPNVRVLTVVSEFRVYSNFKFPRIPCICPNVEEIVVDTSTAVRKNILKLLKI